MWRCEGRGSARGACGGASGWGGRAGRGPVAGWVERFAFDQLSLRPRGRYTSPTPGRIADGTSIGDRKPEGWGGQNHGRPQPGRRSRGTRAQDHACRPGSPGGAALSLARGHRARRPGRAAHERGRSPAGGDGYPAVRPPPPPRRRLDPTDVAAYEKGAVERRALDRALGVAEGDAEFVVIDTPSGLGRVTSAADAADFHSPRLPDGEPVPPLDRPGPQGDRAHPDDRKPAIAAARHPADHGGARPADVARRPRRDLEPSDALETIVPRRACSSSERAGIP